MGFNTFIIISLVFTVIGIRVLIQVVQNWRGIWDDRYTLFDRSLVNQASFFLLVPISVALHELGHAVAIWMYGGSVVGFGFYFYAGYVSYAEPFTDAQRIIVAAAGPLVNVILCAASFWVVFWRRPPFKAQVNELLFTFAVISGLNALVFYPLLDFGANFGGDWVQIYRGGVPSLALAIGVIHGGILLAAFHAWRDPRVKAALNQRIGLPPDADRGMLGGMSQPSRSTQRAGSGAFPVGGPGRAARWSSTSDALLPADHPLSHAERTLREAAERVVSGWMVPVQVALAPVPARGRSIEAHDGQRAFVDRPAGLALGLVWSSPSDQRLRRVIARVTEDGAMQIVGEAGGSGGPGDGPPRVGRLGDHATVPTTDDLTLLIRQSMEEVERWREYVVDARPGTHPVG